MATSGWHYHDSYMECKHCRKGFTFYSKKNKPRKRKYCSFKCVGLSRIRINGGINAMGYRRITLENGRRVTEHVYKVENVLSRKLKKNEVVHHINGIKLDNRNCNLLICDRSYHGLLHQKMAKQYQKIFLGGE